MGQTEQLFHATWDHGDGRCHLVHLAFPETAHQAITLVWTGWHTIADSILIDPGAGEPLDEAKRTRLAPYLARAPRQAREAIARFSR